MRPYFKRVSGCPSAEAVPPSHTLLISGLRILAADCNHDNAILNVDVSTKRLKKKIDWRKEKKRKGIVVRWRLLRQKFREQEREFGTKTNGIKKLSNLKIFGFPHLPPLHLAPEIGVQLHFLTETNIY